MEQDEKLLISRKRESLNAKRLNTIYFEQTFTLQAPSNVIIVSFDKNTLGL